MRRTRAFSFAPTRIGRRGPIAVATSGADALAVSAWDDGDQGIAGDSIAGSYYGRATLIVTALAHVGYGTTIGFFAARSFPFLIGFAP